MKNMKEDLQEKKEKEKEIINSLGFMAQCGLESTNHIMEVGLFNACLF
jgi:hypothetical protein